jgi:hypothetical protein
MYGATVTMVCEYKVGESEYVDSIKWYKDNREFYRIVPHTSIEKDKVVTFNRSGINLDLQRSGVSTITKGQLISKRLFKVFICKKNQQRYFCISALASKKRSNKENKGTLYH